MSRHLRIALFSNGRFHLCDLARELDALGHEVKFYSLVPPWRTRKFGLPDRCSRWLLPAVAHWFGLARALRSTPYAESARRKLVEALDLAGARSIEPCDVFIGMSGMCNQVAPQARQKHGAKIWIERGSRHILSQKQILDSIPGADRVSDYAVRRELADYAVADVVVVLSKHCEESFLERNFPPERLFRNSPGVQLQMFPPTPAPLSLKPTVLMTGLWSLQKGCDVLWQAVESLADVHLHHVGDVGDCPLPSSGRFRHTARVDQTLLWRHYANAHVFALASRQEGLATVLPQALASGLRVVCTTRTGGEDLKAFVEDPSVIRVVPPDDARTLADALAQSLRDAEADKGLRDRLGSARDALSWKGSARRYHDALMEHV